MHQIVSAKGHQWVNGCEHQRVRASEHRRVITLEGQSIRMSEHRASASEWVRASESERRRVRVSNSQRVRRGLREEQTGSSNCLSWLERIRYKMGVYPALNTHYWIIKHSVLAAIRIQTRIQNYTGKYSTPELNATEPNNHSVSWGQFTKPSEFKYIFQLRVIVFSQGEGG